MEVLGLDIGGTGIKGALIDPLTGEMRTERIRLLTPAEGTPEAIVATCAEVVAQFSWRGPVGIGFPGVIRHQTIHTAANLNPACIDAPLAQMFTEATGCPGWLINDADAAGLAELRFGEGRDVEGTVILLTIGTGIGSAIFSRGHLQANTEFGHLTFKGKPAEATLSEVVRKKKDMSFKQWGKRFNEYLHELHKLFWPEMFILGGGGAKKRAKFEAYLDVPAPIAWAHFGNRAGMIGAAVAAWENLPRPQAAAPATEAAESTS